MPMLPIHYKWLREGVERYLQTHSVGDLSRTTDVSVDVIEDVRDGRGAYINITQATRLCIAVHIQILY